MGGGEVDADGQERMAKWIEEGQHVLALLSGRLKELERVKAEAERTEQEYAGLRREIDNLRHERAELIQTIADALKSMNEMLTARAIRHTTLGS